MSDERTSFIKTPKQLVIVVVLALAVPVGLFVLLSQLITGVRPVGRPEAETGVLNRIKPAGEVTLVDASAPQGTRATSFARRRGGTAARSGTGVRPHGRAASRPQSCRLMSPLNPLRPELLSFNTATVRKQWGLPEIIAGCVRRGIRLLSPWRDQVAATGLKATAQRLRDVGVGCRVTAVAECSPPRAAPGA